MVRLGWWFFLLVLAVVGLAVDGPRSALAAPARVDDSAVASAPAEDDQSRGPGGLPGGLGADGEGSDGEGELDEDATDRLCGSPQAPNVPATPHDASELVAPAASRVRQAEPVGLYRPPRS